MVVLGALETVVVEGAFAVGLAEGVAVVLAANGAEAPEYLEGLKGVPEEVLLFAGAELDFVVVDGVGGLVAVVVVVDVLVGQVALLHGGLGREMLPDVDLFEAAAGTLDVELPLEGDVLEDLGKKGTLSKWRVLWTNWQRFCTIFSSSAE